MKKLHDESCYACRFALEARDLPRYGEQVRCSKAEELFGGTRWVNVRKGKNGDVLKSHCGHFEHFKGDDSTAPEPKPKQKVMKLCETCRGSGKVIIQFVHSREAMVCYKCKGKGKLPIDDN